MNPNYVFILRKRIENLEDTVKQTLTTLSLHSGSTITKQKIEEVKSDFNQQMIDLRIDLDKTAP